MDSVSHAPRARVKHQCDCCHGIIYPGETYRRESCFGDGRAWTWKTCTECEDILPEVYARAGYPDEGVTHDDYYEWACEHTELPEVTELPEARAYLHRREHGRPEPKGEAA